MNISGLLFLLLGISVQLYHREWTLDSPLYFPEWWMRACPLVGLDGLEPSTSRLSGARSNHLSYKPLLCVDSSHLPYPCCLSSVRSLGFFRHREWISEFPLNFPELGRRTLSGGGDDGIRTHDPLLAGQVLSQLSYTPIPRALFFSKTIAGPWKLNNKRNVPSFLCTDLVLTRMTESWHSVPVSIERRWSSRTFRYGYLVTT